MSNLRYLCLFANSDVQRILCCVFVSFDFGLCTLCCQFLWIFFISSIASEVTKATQGGDTLSE